MNEQQLAAVEAHGEVFVSAGAGTGKTRVLVERFVRAVCDDGLDVESVLVITYTRKAAGELRSRIRDELTDARPVRPCATARRRVDLDDPRLLRPPPARASVRRRDRPALPRARRGARRGPSRRGIRAGARCVLRDARARAAPAPRDLWQRPPAEAAHERLRDAALGRPAARARAGARAVSRRGARVAPRCGAMPGRRRRGNREPEGGRGRGARSAVDTRAARRAEGAARKWRARSELRGGAERSHAVRAGRARPARPSAAAGAARALRRRVRRRQGARVGARLRRPPAPRARPARRRRAHSRGRAAALPRDHGRRVPGHERAAVRADRPARRWPGSAKDVFFVGDEFQSIYGFRHADVEVFRAAARSCVAAAAADRELPLAARGARRRQLPVRLGVRRRTTSR